MISLYPLIKHIHVASVLLSFALFVARGGLMLAEVNWRRSRALRVAPHVVDTVLLASAIVLAVLLHQYPFIHAWLTAKVLALIVYIVLGSCALKRARTRRSRAVFFVLAVFTFLYIVGVARARHPLGVFTLL